MPQRNWGEASKQFTEVIGSGKNALVANYADNFTENNENDSDSVYEVQFSGVN